MGGAIVTSFLYRSELAEGVRAVILDAPALNLAAAGDMKLRDGGVPGWLTGTMRRVASWRYDIDWESMDHLQHADDLDVPMLILHGDEDETAPASSSQELAELRPDIVTYVEMTGVGHVRGWNEAQGPYLDAIEAYLDRVVDLAGAGD
jgi:pimeloyl-ACP methyl ester carboxylesterase